MWAFSPDRKAVLVIADPGSVENEPVPNGFFFGDENAWVSRHKWTASGMSRPRPIGNGSDSVAPTPWWVARERAATSLPMSRGGLRSIPRRFARARSRRAECQCPAPSRRLVSFAFRTTRARRRRRQRRAEAIPGRAGLARSLDDRWLHARARQQPARATGQRAEPDVVGARPGDGSSCTERCRRNASLADVKLTVGPTLDRSRADRSEQRASDLSPARQPDFQRAERARSDHARRDDSGNGNESGARASSVLGSRSPPRRAAATSSRWRRGASPIRTR